MLTTFVWIHDRIFEVIQRFFGDWFLGLFARLVFASVLLQFFWNSALTKVVNPRTGADGFFDYFTLQDNAMAQIAPKAFEAVGYDASQLGLGYWLIGYAGAYAEFVLPLLIVLGLCTRLASIGMIGFIAVMSWVDVTGHGADETTIGAPFDRIADSIIADQRLLWITPLVYLILRGAGTVSLDGVLRTFR